MQSFNPIDASEEADGLWKKIEQLDANLRRQATKAEEKHVPEWKRLEAHIFNNDQTLKDLVDWESMSDGLEKLALQANSPMGGYKFAMGLHGVIMNFPWIHFLFPDEFRGIVWCIAILLASPFWIPAWILVKLWTMYERSKVVQSVKNTVQLRLIHFVDQDDSMEYPLTFHKLDFAPNTVPPVTNRLVYFKNIELPASGSAIEVSTDSGELLGVIGTGKSGTKFELFGDLNYEVRIGNGFIELADRNRLAIKEFDLFEAQFASAKSVADMETIRKAWENIVLPEQVEEHLLRSMILFAHGNQSAPRGILLKGPPGTGKSLVAKTMAESFGASFFMRSVADLKGAHIGESGEKSSQLWREARSNTPAVIFIDECEGVFARRGSDQGDTFINEIIQTFLTEWDGIGSTNRILVIGATNRPDILDDAVVSRFTDVIELPAPNSAERVKMISAIARQIGLVATVPEAVMKEMGGMSGREVRNVLEQSMRLAAPESPSEKHFLLGVARVRGKVSTAVNKDSGWSSLVVADDLLRRLKTTCQMVRESEGLIASGIPVPRTMLLYGPPGSGKTQIARVLAAEAGVGFIAKTTAELKGQYLGHAAGRISDTFKTARGASPCILFIDEIDALTSTRGGISIDQLQVEALTQLLQELDGVGAQSGFVFVLAATNRLHDIDSAILSRFAQQIEVSLPDATARYRMLEVLLEGRPVYENINLNVIVAETDGRAGRDLREIVTVAFNFAVERTIFAGASAVDTRLSTEDLIKAVRSLSV
jgi:transitional endoplasmic reticulum ATPase